MSNSIQVPEIERVTFFTGQRLTAGDLTALDESHRELRWLHNQSLHAWGIGIGLEVAGERGATAVVVQPGYAIDRLGREIVLTEPRTIPIPAVEGAGGGDAVFYLTARYVPDAEQHAIEKRPGVCLSGGTVRLSDEPAIGWRAVGSVSEGLTLILATARVRNCALSAPVSGASRRYARPAQLPYVAGGQTVAAKTVWQPWSPSGVVVGQLTRVDTSRARFRTVPQYFARVDGDVLLLFPSPVLVVGFPEIAEASPLGFTLRVLFPQLNVTVNPPPLRDPVAGPKMLADLGWSVVWTGIEG
jgi:hypothetical protein